MKFMELALPAPIVSETAALPTPLVAIPRLLPKEIMPLVGVEARGRLKLAVVELLLMPPYRYRLSPVLICEVPSRLTLVLFSEMLLLTFSRDAPSKFRAEGVTELALPMFMLPVRFKVVELDSNT